VWLVAGVRRILDPLYSGQSKSNLRVRVDGLRPPVFRRFADSLAPHQNLVRAETAAEPAGIKVIHVYGIAL
jgi:hypothetical protein